MRFLPGSNAEAELRTHAPVNLGNSRLGEDSSHALCTELRPEDEERVRLVEIKRGDITVHDQRVVHGSGPNTSEGWRRAYVLAGLYSTSSIHTIHASFRVFAPRLSSHE